jgi:hypothetical protein
LIESTLRGLFLPQGSKAHSTDTLMFYYPFTLLVVLSLTVPVALGAAGEWTQLSTGGEKIEALVERDGFLHFPAPVSQTAGFGGSLLVSEFPDSMCVGVEKCSGRGGLIAMTEAGLGGAFLAVCRETGGELTIYHKTADGKVEKSGLSAPSSGDSSLRLTRRGDFIYAHLGAEPLVAFQFEGVKKILGGVIALDELHFSQPQMTAIPQTQFTTYDLRRASAGISFVGDWREVQDPTAIGKSSLLNDGKEVVASASVQIKGVLAGEHELWVRYPVGPEGTHEAEVAVTGLAETQAVTLNQQIGSQLWVALGSFQTSGLSNALITLRTLNPGSGFLRLDAIQSVWSSWKDENGDGVPDGLTLAEWKKRKRQPMSLNQTSGIGALAPSEDQVKDVNSLVPTSLVQNGRAVVYVDGVIGDDSADGSRARFAIARSASAKKQGPKRTLMKALEAVGDATDIEVHVGGVVEMSDSFSAMKALNPKAGIRFISGPEGAIFTTPLAPGVKAPNLPAFKPPMPPPPSVVTPKLSTLDHEK